HLNGRQALALARTRKNDCNPAENDLTRARRQQQILSAMKSRLFAPATFLRLPWVSWYTPKTMRTDMGGGTLLGFFAAAATSGSPPGGGRARAGCLPARRAGRPPAGGGAETLGVRDAARRRLGPRRLRRRQAGGG